jgi:translation initiation factor IF-2
MEELIFFGLIIFFSIIESIARSRKQKQGGQLPEVPPDWEQPRAESRPRPKARPRPQPTEIPSYDADPSFDSEPLEARDSHDDAKSREAVERARARSSESMIPSEVWDEIAGMAREPARQEPSYTPPAPKPRNAPAPHPKRPPIPQRPKPAPTSRAPVQRRAPQPKRATILAAEPAPEGVAEHAVHQSHVGYGTDPSGRAPSAQDGLDPLGRVLSRDASAARAQLRGQGEHALRQALILSEVLGPPVADRPDRY